MMCMNLSDIAILKMENTGYHCIITRISKTDAINLLQNIDSTEKIGTLEKPRAIWSYKFTRNSNLKKMETYRLKENKKIWNYR